MMSLASGKQTPRFCQCQRQYIVRLHAAGRMRRSADGKQNGETASVYEVAAFPSPTESASPSPPSIAAELNSMLCRLARLGLRRRRGEVDIEDHGAVLMAEYRRRTQAQGVCEESSLADARAQVRVHRSRGSTRNREQVEKRARQLRNASRDRHESREVAVA